MENTFAIFEKEDKFCPILLEGILHTEFFEKNPFEAKDPDAGEWRTSKNIMTDLPEELWFVSKDRNYNFDLRWKRDGFFVSIEFLNLLNKFGIGNFHYTKLHMVNKHKESITSKEYFYVRFYNRLEDVIDMEKSNIEFYKQNGLMKKIWDLQLKNANVLNLKGIIFVPSNEAGVYKP